MLTEGKKSLCKAQVHKSVEINFSNVAVWHSEAVLQGQDESLLSACTIKYIFPSYSLNNLSTSI